MKEQFDVEPNAIIDGLPAYDYGSIMHYNLFAFSKHLFKRTISVLPWRQILKSLIVGQRNGPSRRDKEWLNEVYCTAG